VRAAQLHVIFNILLGIRVVGSALTQGVVALASLHCQLTSTVITLLQLFGTSVARVRPVLLIFKANSFVINHRLLSESSGVSIYVAIGRTLGRPHFPATFKLTPRNGDFGCLGGGAIAPLELTPSQLIHAHETSNNNNNNNNNNKL